MENYTTVKDNKILSEAEKTKLKNTILLKTGNDIYYNAINEPEKIKFDMFIKMGECIYECRDCLITSLNNTVNTDEFSTTFGNKIKYQSNNTTSTITITSNFVTTHFNDKQMIDKFDFMYDNNIRLVDNIVEKPQKTVEKVVEKIVEKIVYVEKTPPSFKEIYNKYYDKIYKYLI